MGKINKKNAPYLFLIPFAVFFFVFMLYPLGFSLLLSFGKYKSGQLMITGFNNFRFVFTDPMFYKSIGNTFLIMAVQVPLMTFFALVLAYFLNNRLVKGVGIFRMLVFMPIILDAVSYSIIFRLFFNADNGLFNNAIKALGGTGPQWLSVGWLAQGVIIAVITWRWTGYNTIILLSGMQSISYDLYESASMDGATGVQKFIHITIPGVKPVLIFSVINSVNGTLQLFTEPFIITSGGPAYKTLTIVGYLYEKGFKGFDFGVASAGSYILVIIIAILTFIQLQVTKEKD